MGVTPARTHRWFARLLMVGVVTLPGAAAWGQTLGIGFSPVPGSDAQPGGPTYDYRISTHEVRNNQFVIFLNDALVNLDNARGQFMFFDTTTGDVYINDATLGETGDDPEVLSVKLFSPGVSGQIEFDAATEMYRVVTSPIDYGAHPVTGLSWYGALKFCNWLTLQAGISADQVAYSEGPATEDWHPITIASNDWGQRDLDDQERADLVNLLGYRLPMDGGALQADSYNEWYKAAAWNGSGDNLFGFGRDVLGDGDANYFDSGDPFDALTPATTPVGFYDGTVYPQDFFFAGSITFNSAANDNRYGVFDLTGNVWEWMQDQGFSTDQRCYRGGGWNAPDGFVGNTAFTADQPDALRTWVGFRVVQADLHLPPLLEPEDDQLAGFLGAQGGPFTPVSVQLTLTSRSPDPLSWNVSFPNGESWLAAGDENDESSGTVGPFGTVTLAVTLTDTAMALPQGSHAASLALSFTSDTEVFTNIARTVLLEVTGALAVDPSDGLAAAGPAGGPFFPDQKAYTLTNGSADALFWEVRAEPADWIVVEGPGGLSSGSLAPGLSADITVSLGAGVDALASGQEHSARVVFENILTGDTAVREVTVDVGEVPLTVLMAIVPAADVQVSGPAHDYRISLFEITNTQYVGFVNDALGNKANERGAFVYVDTATGDVYINTDATGAEGVGADGRTTLLFRPSIGGGIEFSNGRYRIVDGATQLPVAGVSWYGALKFCNWLTLRQGLDPAERAYNEGATPQDWHPVTISNADWLLRDLSDQERALIVGLRGYRLPMDGGTDQAGLYNEWHKAASRKQDDENGDPVFGALYGFGRDVVGATDANYLGSGDPFDDGPAPVGWFDGVNVLADLGTTSALTQNGYGLFDVTGNVSEWVQDQGGDPSLRATRGGHWQSLEDSLFLDNDHRREDLPESTRSFTGFRIVQSMLGGPVEVSPSCDGAEPCDFIAAGPVAGPYNPSSFGYTVANNEGGVRAFRVCADEDWVTLNGGESCVNGLVVSSEAPADIVAGIGEKADALRAADQPPVGMAVVPGSDVQGGGPEYSFRVATLEVTNEDFAAFLNNAIANPANQRGQFMFFDTDTGSVFINDQAGGTVGSDEGALSTALFDATVNPRIPFDATAEAYTVESGFELHPVVGVSWFGALKYCNWLTIDSGLSVSDRAYSEGSNVGDWHAVTIATVDWWGDEDTSVAVPAGPGRDLNDTERGELVETVRGFRLPMDDGDGGSKFNEWLKAATARVDTVGGGVTVFDSVYGFGRDTLGGGDANFDTSADPFECAGACVTGTSPVGFYVDATYNPGGDGPVGNGLEFTAAGGENAYEIFDLSGNVAEWMQDRGSTLTERAVRGGSWRSLSGSGELTVVNRMAATSSEVRDDVGFRVVQAKLDHVATITFTDVTREVEFTAKVRLLLTEPLSIDPDVGFDATGLFGGPFVGGSRSYTLSSRSETDMDWKVTVSQSGPQWLDVNDDLFASGTISVALDVTVDITLSDQAATLAPGTYTATARFENVTTGYFETRDFTLTIDDVLMVCELPVQEPCAEQSLDITKTWMVPLEGPVSRTYQLSSLSASPIDYSIQFSAAWLRVAAGSEASGTLAPAGDPGEADLVQITIEAVDIPESLPVGDTVETITFRNDSSGGETTRQVILSITDPLRIVETEALTWEGPDGNGAFAPVGISALTLRNVHPDTVLSYAVTSDVDWLDINGGAAFADDSLFPSPPDQIIDLVINDQATGLNPGEYEGTLFFEDVTSGHTQERPVILTVTGALSVTPLTDLVTIGREGGPFDPPSETYTLSNGDVINPLDWTVTVEPAVSWLMVSLAAGTLSPGQSIEVEVSVDLLGAGSLTEVGSPYTTILRISTSVSALAVTRVVTLNVVEPDFVVDDRLVPGGIVQPGGPQYSFRMATFPTTNQQYASFLNDALTNPSHERGQYLFFDSVTGIVYVNDAVDGGSGADPGSLTTVVFSPSAAPGIEFVDLQTGYQAASGFESHPVTGMSWFGAVKFCNWLTLDQGLAASERCYTEDVATNLFGWRPSTITDSNWQTRGLIDEERDVLVTGYRGFRLPMDDGFGNQERATDGADLYDEWYKAASFRGFDGTGQPLFDAVYGFGRDVLGPADANYRCSDDPFEDADDCKIGGTTPVGLYDGINLLADGVTATTANENGFGLFDLTGNVFHWMQGRFTDSAGVLSERTIRGGSYRVPVGDTRLTASARAGTGAAFVFDQTGFRVVRTTSEGDLTGDGLVGQEDWIELQACLLGPAIIGRSDCAIADLTGDGRVDLRDAAAFQVLFDSGS